MTRPARTGEEVPGQLRPAAGLQLLGEYQGSGFTQPRYLVRRGDGQVIQLSRLLYLVVVAVADGDADGGWDAGCVAARVSAQIGREVTAGNVCYLTTGKLAPLGLVLAGGPVPRRDTYAGPPQQAPRMNLLLGLRIRGVLLRPRAAGAVGGALAWLHHPIPVAAVVLGFTAFEAWLFGVQGAIGPLVAVLRHPPLFAAVAGLTLASLVFHEFGHASACRYGGARPGVIGFGLYLVWPSLYTDVTDAYRLGRAGRLRTDLGGVYFNAIFVLAMGGCYAAIGQPVFLAAAFLGNLEILQQLVPVVRMDGYFILADLAGVPDLLGQLVQIMASLLPGTVGRPAAARVRTLRRGPRFIVTAWVLLAVPLLAAAAAYALWNLPVIAATTGGSFIHTLEAARAGFSAGQPAAIVGDVINMVLLAIPMAGLACLLARIAARGAAAAVRCARRLRPRMPVRALTAGIAALVIADAGVAAIGLARLLAPAPPHQPVAAAPRDQPGRQAGSGAQPGTSAKAPSVRGSAPSDKSPSPPSADPPRSPVMANGAASASQPRSAAVPPSPGSGSASAAGAHHPPPAARGSSPGAGGTSAPPSCLIATRGSLLRLGVLCG